jgi:tetratricopeptide (TPR) repeat protein
LRTIAIAAVAIALVAAPAGIARAQNKAAAEQLFKDGRRLMKAKKYAAACKKFEASHQLDPALGTLLNLATCLQKEGKIASAWARFVEAADKAKRARQRRRYRYARKRARALARRVPRLSIKAPSIDGLVIRRNGTEIKAAMLDTKLPVDPGPHDIVASAPGYQSFEKRVIARAGKTTRVEIPMLDKAAPKKAPPKMVRKTPAPEKKPEVTAVDEPEPKSGSRGRGRRLGGATLAATGLVVTGIGLVFGAQARSKWNEAFDDGHCNDNNVCNQTGYDLTEDARSKATLSTVFVGLGLAAAGVGGYLYFTAPKGKQPRVEASVGKDRAVIMVRGGF